MGLVEHFTRNQELRRQLSSWLATNTRTLRHCATLVARGTEIQIDSLVEFASDQLLPLCSEVLTNQTDPTKGIATALAEAGVLPMYGMPTMVRDLYFDLPRATSSTEAKIVMDRNLSQAILEFAPNNELVWDKRLLKVRGSISGSLRPSRIRNGNWEVTTPAVSSVQRQLFCKACRHFQFEEIKLSEVDMMLV